jgi:hypothetical protein
MLCFLETAGCAVHTLQWEWREWALTHLAQYVEHDGPEAAKEGVFSYGHGGLALTVSLQSVL